MRSGNDNALLQLSAVDCTILTQGGCVKSVSGGETQCLSNMTCMLEQCASGYLMAFACFLYGMHVV